MGQPNMLFEALKLSYVGTSLCGLQYHSTAASLATCANTQAGSILRHLVVSS